MIPELGHFALIIGLAFALCLSIVPLIGVAQNNQQLINSAKPLSFGLFLFVGISICLLAYSFTVDDFSVKYIANHSNSLLPYYFKISAVWGGHEGSMLFWVFALKCHVYSLLHFFGEKKVGSRKVLFSKPIFMKS